MKRNYDQAISDFTMAIRLDPKCALAYYNRHLAYQSKGDYLKAIADLTAATHPNPKSLALAFYDRGVSLGMKARRDCD